MDIWEGVSLTIVLVMALYGCAQLLRHTVEWLLRPKQQRLYVLLRLAGTVEEVEQQVRYAKEWASARHLPLLIGDDGMDNETHTIATALAAVDACEILPLSGSQKIPHSTCTDEEICV